MLNDAKIRAAKPRDKAYKLTDSLYLLVKPGGSKLWKWAAHMTANRGRCTSASIRKSRSSTRGRDVTRPRRF